MRVVAVNLRSMLLWIYDLPTWLFGILMVGAFVLLSVGGLLATRRLVERIVGPPPTHLHRVESFIHAAFVLYGLVAGLLAVAVWQRHTAVADLINDEAASLAAIYRDVSSYPQPYKGDLTSEIRSYTRYIIDEAWPLQRRGIVPSRGIVLVDAIEQTLYSYEPKTEGQKIVHASAVNEFNRYVTLRRSRLHEVASGLPAALWVVIMIGGLLSIGITYFLAIERFGIQIAMTALASILVGMLIFVIAVMDNPLRGRVGIGPEPFELVYHQLMVGR